MARVKITVEDAVDEKTGEPTIRVGCSFKPGCPRSGPRTNAQEIGMVLYKHLNERAKGGGDATEQGTGGEVPGTGG